MHSYSHWINWICGHWVRESPRDENRETPPRSPNPSRVFAMKLSVSTYSLAQWRAAHHKTLEQSLAQIAGMGVKAVEFSGIDVEPGQNPIRRAAALRRRCEKLGMKVISYCVGAELMVSSARQRATVERLKSEVDVAAELGVPSMRHDVTRGFEAYRGFRGPKTFASALKILVPAIRHVADHAESRGVITSLENHGFYMQASKRVEKLIQTVAHRAFRLTMDMGNFLCVNEDPLEAVRRLVRYAVHVHVKDFHVKPKQEAPPNGWFATPTSIALRGAIVGHGVIDVPAQLRLLARAGYHGYLSLEFEGIEEPTKGVQLGLEFLREQLNRLS